VGPVTGPLAERRLGVLLHPTSLPGADLGADAHAYLDWLVAAGVGVWQMLPLGPTAPGGSPYQCFSAQAGNPELIALQALVDAGWLSAPIPADRAQALERARAGFKRRAPGEAKDAFQQFCGRHRDWLEDYVLFQALREEQGGAPWWDWDADLRARAPEALAATRRRLASRLDQLRFEQYLFFTQWGALKQAANARGLRLFGDMPIFVAHDSADVWARPEQFDLDAAGQPRHVAGVPPDYFSETGQRWGNPLYDWARMAEDDFAWWKLRVRAQRELFDLIRIDHFRGFESYWRIPAEEPTAIKGRWVPAPGEALLRALLEEFGELPLVAEDLGVITPEVEALRDAFELPGMKILQFAFDGGPTNPYLPHNHVPNCVVYTGTHDNDTTLGWFQALPQGLREGVAEYLARPGEEMPWPLIRAALASVARLAVLPMQDLLCLDGAARMNTPGTTEGNWQWQFDWAQVPEGLAGHVRHLAGLYGRA
jgi:4-alpha-glucanotransferase